jgi:hypothetical protein
LNRQTLRTTFGAQVLRKVLFAIYGGTIGALYMGLVSRLLPVHPAIFWAGLVIAVVLMARFALQIATRPTGNKTDRDRCFTVAIVPMVLIGVVFIGVAVLMMLPVVFIAGWREERRFRKQLNGQGRFVRARDLEPRLAAGRGTLIEQHGPKSVERIWYTDDDVRAQGSPARDYDHAFNESCRQQYLDRSSGKAILTTIPPSSRRKQLATRYPQMTIVRVFDLDYRPPQPLNASDASDQRSDPPRAD